MLQENFSLTNTTTYGFDHIVSGNVCIISTQVTYMVYHTDLGS